MGIIGIQITSLRTTRLLTACLLSIFLLPAVQAQIMPERTKLYNLNEGLAIKGYDPVSYFTSKKAVKGAEMLTTAYKGVTYRFASAENRAKFLKNPAAYEPAYGGWCAYAMGDSGEKVSIDPETFEIRDGHLYLFYNKFFNNTLPKWQKDEPALQRKADQNWTKLTGK